MRTISFAEDNPQAGTWFSLIHQSFAQAQPGARPVRTLALERDVLGKLAAISYPVGDPSASGAQPRRLREPRTVSFTEPEFSLISTYLAGAGFQPYLSASLLDLHEFLASAPSTGE